MKKYRIVLSLLLISLFVAGTANAEYWFQFGARGDIATQNNNGVSAMIQTIVPQNAVNTGSLGFWVGEDLSDGSFVQVGYVVENQTGYYPNYCSAAGCNSTVYLTAGNAQWFYEYFISGQNSGFLGAIGSDGSAGVNGTFNNYSLYSSGDTWFFKMNNKVLGEVNMPTSSSGGNSPVAFGEVANTSTNQQYVKDVAFSNFSFYKSGSWMHVGKGLSYSGYGVGSLQYIPDLYGVMEIGNRTNYFEVGSGLPSVNYAQLWSLGYKLSIVSNFAMLDSSQIYNAYSLVGISAPRTVNGSESSRMVFDGWVGLGSGSYTGPDNSTVLPMDQNITERAIYTNQYMLNVSSSYGKVSGGGWYNQSSVAVYSVSNSTVYVGKGQREIFDGWSNGNRNLSGTVEIDMPTNIQARWITEYYVNATSDFNSVSGGGWYSAGTSADISLNNSVYVVDHGTRYAFMNWTEGGNSTELEVVVNRSIEEHANFQEQYLTGFRWENGYGQPIAIGKFVINNYTFSNQSFLDANKSYLLTGAFYKGVELKTNVAIIPSSPKTISIKLPVYNEQIYTKDLLFGIPVNALVTVRFANFTRVSLYSGGNGSIGFSNLPYGYVNGTVSAPFEQGLQAQNGVEQTVYLFSFADLVVILIIIMIIIGSYLEFRHKMGKLVNK